jgi:hypothetical protein
VSPFGRIEHVPADINNLRTFVDFEVIESVDDSCPYPALFGIDWDFINMTVVDLKKARITFEGNGLKVISPLDLDEGHRYTKPIREEDHTYELENIYKLTLGQYDYINYTIDGNTSWRSDAGASQAANQASMKEEDN